MRTTLWRLDDLSQPLQRQSFAVLQTEQQRQ